MRRTIIDEDSPMLGPWRLLELTHGVLQDGID